MTERNPLPKWRDFLSKNRDIEFVWLYFIPYHGLPLVRMFPVARFTEMLEWETRPTIPSCITHLLLNDTLVSGADPTGVIYLKPDVWNIFCQTTAGSRKAVMMTSWFDEDGSPRDECPRSRLHTLGGELGQMGWRPLVGFEVEVVFLEIDPNGDYNAAGKNHSWSTMTMEDYTFLPMVEEIVRTLLQMDIEIQHFHAESGPGQWEFVLPPNNPVSAVDTLVIARKMIEVIAARHNLRATLYPRLSNQYAGTASHVHISVNPINQLQDGELDQRSDFFLAGVLAHLPAVLAFTLPQDISYARVQTGVWSGGEYAAWGWQNRETPLRRVERNRFEFKLLDGLANPYIALAAILAAGIDGIRSRTELTAWDCKRPPGLMCEEERKAVGVTTMLPKSINASLDCLVADRKLQEVLGSTMTKSYIEFKRGETAFLNAMAPQERFKFLVCRY
ncbi:Developmental protein fluG [Aspergillus sclerotialis]|uniref:Developmental protein fluG n=1 Tax=Aspergillus sclerotialis TaxID=2070753 RepID=A0A3A2ZR38_9EURO|nr:Developmental protein fluG [Aspergillus sclerotialis]